MPNWCWSLISFVFVFVLAFVFQMPLLILLAVVFPVYLILATMFSLNFSFRGSLKPSSIPKRFYNRRKSDLNRDVLYLRENGFAMSDYFYLRMIPDVIVYALEHPEKPVHFCLYHFGSRIAYDIVTRYNNDFTLTTSDKVDAGVVPRPEKQFLQIVQTGDLMELLRAHLESDKFLLQQGLKHYPMNKDDFRYEFMKAFHDQSKIIRKLPVWPVTLIYRTFARSGREYTYPIEEQYRKGKISIWQ